MAEPTTSWLSDDEQRVWRAFIVAAHEVEAALDRQLQRDAGLPHAHYGILVFLAEQDEHEIRMGELADLLHYSRSRLAHAVTKLESQGWVTRRSCPDDGRGQIATITPTGLAALAQAAPRHVAEVRRLIFDVVPPGEREAFHAALSSIAAQATSRPPS